MKWCILNIDGDFLCHECDTFKNLLNFETDAMEILYFPGEFAEMKKVRSSIHYSFAGNDSI